MRTLDFMASVVYFVNVVMSSVVTASLGAFALYYQSCKWLRFYCISSAVATPNASADEFLGQKKWTVLGSLGLLLA